MTPLDPVWRIAPELAAQQPEAARLLDITNQHAWSAVAPDLLELLRLRIALLIGNQAGLQRRSHAARAAGLTEEKIAQIGDYPGAAAFSALEKACLSFTEQFVIDVANLTDDHRALLRAHFSAAQLDVFVMALYVTECTQRLEVAAPMLLEALPLTATARATAVQESPEARLMPAMDAYQAAVVRGTALDPVTSEMVRLRCARTHNCRFCRTLRLQDAVAAGVDDTMTGKIDRYESSDLDERTKIALRITDAFITRPDTLSTAVCSAARVAFTASERAEMLLDITKWSTQKYHVAMGLDGADALPKNPQGVSFFAFDADGEVAGFADAPSIAG